MHQPSDDMGEQERYCTIQDAGASANHKYIVLPNKCQISPAAAHAASGLAAYF